jgi:CRISPR system Cascade subunit CasE
MPESNGTDGFHMVQLRLDARRLAGLGQRLGLFKQHRQVSTNYLAHCALGELFQDQAPKPFCVQDAPRQMGEKAGRGVRVLGYTSAEDKVLQELAKAFAPPALYKGCNWDDLATKPMPQVFPEGMGLRFELRACPVVRKSSGGPKWNAGQELDAFLSHVWELDDPDVEVSREDVYHDWLSRQLDLRGGAEANGIGMERFSIERMTRRSHGDDRTVHTIQRPDVTLTGTMTVTDGPAFANLLKSGIGRHKSFGYGMLKVRRA